MPRPKRPWSKVIEDTGVRIRIFEREAGSVLYRETRDADGRKDRRSLAHRDRALAEAQARQLARRLGELRLAGSVGPVTLGQVYALYAQHRLPLLSPARQRHAAQHAAFLLAHLGRDFVLEQLSQTHVDTFAKRRKAGELRSKKVPGDRIATVRDGTVRQNLNWLSALLRWARGYRVAGGRRLMTADPLEGVTLPQERNVRRPVASSARYEQTLAQCDAVDPTGRLACLLALARCTGRRLNAMLQLRASDVLLSRDAVLRALAAGGRDEREADHAPHGAIRWRAEHDKLGFEELTPISRAARDALDAYLRHAPAVGDAPLFRDARDPTRPMTKAAASHLLARAERRAGLPKLERGLWHPYRRAWASERKHLPDVDTAKAGGWRDLATMRRSYQHADPATTYKVVENAPAGHTADTADSQSAKPQRLT